jgi:hypothetical protein
MGLIRKADEVKLFAGLITASKSLAEEALGMFSERFGRVDHKSPEIDFSFTDYYKSEMGQTLYRYWVSFETLVNPSSLSDAKIYSNVIEEQFMENGQRRVNIDPGYITPAKIVLASSKDFSHRIYLRDGIYAEVTLIYKHKNFTSLPWTYPDYQSPTAFKFFNEIRAKQQSQLKTKH